MRTVSSERLPDLITDTKLLNLIKGLEHYKVYAISCAGILYSCNNGKYGYRKEWKTLIPKIGTHGYYEFPLTFLTKRKTVCIHRLVAQLFLLNPENKEQVNHKDGNKLNNHMDNLEWVTPKENIAHSIMLGSFPLGIKNGMSKLTELDVKEIRKLFLSNESKESISIRFNISISHVTSIINKNRWAHINP